MSFDGDCIHNSETITDVQSQYFCKGLQLVMNISITSWACIHWESSHSSGMPIDLRGQSSNTKMKDDNPCLPVLMQHLDYLLNLGEIRATRNVSTLLDGVASHINRNDTVDMVYLPILMGY